ncbi:stage V sporulation protein AC [Bacillus taeanensis]|uniref:Stage V sporulation protein AC n=1 Tax=Bacillus taeanensis TaxID=273032 RepID=A0A366XWU0_9BACI|nr:stage V sporulation protein AC [Bacillus taeanensis]RBW70367.1 stage V sporulation protein AC [Bacillus taeanensis]
MTKLNDKRDYLKNIKLFQPKTPFFLNSLKAFFVGGMICAFGQGIQNLYHTVFYFNEASAVNLTAATLVLIAAVLTGIGIYDKIGQFAGAGSVVPVTGFANSITSAALEHKSEGIVLGVAANLFKLAGSVIVFGVVASYIVGILRLLFSKLLF